MTCCGKKKKKNPPAAILVQFFRVLRVLKSFTIRHITKLDRRTCPPKCPQKRLEKLPPGQLEVPGNGLRRPVSRGLKQPPGGLLVPVRTQRPLPPPEGAPRGREDWSPARPPPREVRKHPLRSTRRGRRAAASCQGSAPQGGRFPESPSGREAGPRRPRSVLFLRESV